MSDDDAYVVDIVRKDLLKSALEDCGIEELTDDQKTKFNQYYSEKFKDDAPDSIITQSGEQSFSSELKELIKKVIE